MRQNTSTDLNTTTARAQYLHDISMADTSVSTAARHAVLRDLIETAVSILLIFCIFRGVLQNYRIDGQSMEPNFHTDQYIWVNKLLYFHFDASAPLRLLPGQDPQPERMVYPVHAPRRGDVVVLEAPSACADCRPDDYIKRVVGLPGEVIQIKDGRVYIDGQPLRELVQEGGYLTQPTDCYSSRLCQPYAIPPGHVVVLGDNRGNSRDSRFFQPEPALPLDRIIGRAWLFYWPPRDWGLVPTTTYGRS